MLRRTATLLPALLILSLALLIAAACGGDDDDDHGMDGGMGGMMMTGNAPAGSIRVGLVNWAVEPEKTSAPAGEVTFWAVHDMKHAHGDAGGNIHDLQVMRKTADGSFELVGEVKDLRMGDAKALTLDLMPGEYELACTVVEVVGEQAIGHYTKGMRTPFTVTG